MRRDFEAQLADEALHTEDKQIAVASEEEDTLIGWVVFIVWCLAPFPQNELVPGPSGRHELLKR